MLNRAELFYFSIPLNRVFTWNSVQRHYREGFLVHLDWEDGRSGWGEISPLPGFSSETLADVKIQLKTVLTSLLEHHSLIPSSSLYPSVAFGIDCALASAESGWPDCIKSPLVYALRSFSQLPRCESDWSFHDRQFGIKVKVSSAQLEEVLESLRHCIAHSGGVARFRLDANRGLSFSEAVTLCEALSHGALYYLEEPLADPSELAALFSQTKVPLALDESLQAAKKLKNIEAIPGVRALVYKPMLCGSFQQLAFWSQYAKKNQKELVISSAYEGAIGWSWLCLLAERFASGLPAGLDTRAAFDEQTVFDGIRASLNPVNATINDVAPYYPKLDLLKAWSRAAGSESVK